MIASHKKIDTSEERRILTRMIVSTPFLSQLKEIIDPKLFQSSYSQTVASWILDFYEHTKEAPGKGIEDIYLKKRHEIQNEDDTELISEFLTALSKDYKRDAVNNVKYSVKTATEYFKIQSMERLKRELDHAVSTRDFRLGEKAISGYRRIERQGSQGVNILQDTDIIKAALSEEHESMFSFPGDLGRVVGQFRRGDFFGIVGAPKRGKTWWLLYTAFRATLMGYRSLFISLEMTEDPMIRRAWKSFTGQPSTSGIIKIPQFTREGEEGKWKISHREEKRNAMSKSQVAEKQKKWKHSVRAGEMKLVTYPAYGASAEDIETLLYNLEFFENYIPDVVVVDYADILKPMDSRLDYRHQIDMTWKRLRSIAQERELLMVTGSQAGRSAFKKDAEEADVAEDYRKIAHITKMISLNQTKAEKRDGVMRVMSLAQREESSDDSQAVVLQCLDIGRPYVDSRLRDSVEMSQYEKKKEKKDDEKEEKEK